MNSMSADLGSAQSIVVAIAHHIDLKAWSYLRALYASEVHTDYTSLFGGTPLKQSGDALVDGWRGSLEGVSTQHLLGPIDVHSRGSRAEASCHVRAMHHAPGAPGGEYWEVLGHYEVSLQAENQGWKVDGMKLHTFMQIGNRSLLEQARAASDK